MIRLEAADGHEFDAYSASPAGAARGGVVVIQEIFGLTPHIRRVVERYADSGFKTLAPALFDRVRPGIVLDYTDVQTGIETMRRLEWPDTLADVAAAVEAVDENLAVGVVGFCWGGTVVHVAAAELPVTAGVAYYGGGIARMLDKRPKCPVMYHFGDQDHSISLDDVEAIRSANPDGIYHIYAGAGHGFNCEDRSSFSPASAELAFERSVAFLREHLA